MAMYQKLAQFYDSLVKDDEATKDWADFIERHARFQKVIEYACGSGEITCELAKRGYEVEASDLSSEMIQQAKEKPFADQIRFSVRDMRTFVPSQADCVICLCDSMNYLLEDEDFQGVLQNAYNNLTSLGTFIFDVHSLDRIEEFQEEFYEEGLIDGKGYEWSILAQDDYLVQNFVFFNENGRPDYEQHIQRVYDPLKIKEWCEQIGFQVEIYTDFIHEGIQEGEKYFYVARKESV